MSKEDNGNQNDEVTRLRKMREAVKDVPDPVRGPVTREVVKTLREAQLGELAEIAERHVAHG